MKKIWSVSDKQGGLIEVNLLKRNNNVSEDLIYLRFKTKKEGESGWCMRPDEALHVIRGLYLAIDEIAERYNLKKFKIKKLLTNSQGK